MSFPQPVAKQFCGKKLASEKVASGKQAVSICSFSSKGVSRWTRAKSKLRLDSLNKGWIDTFLAFLSWCLRGSLVVWVSHSPPRALNTVKLTFLQRMWQIMCVITQSLIFHTNLYTRGKESDWKTFSGDFFRNVFYFHSIN